MRPAVWPWLAVLALSVLALGLRLPLLGQSLFGDELSTWWIVSTQDFSGVVSTVHSDAEITPPLFFLLAELTTRLELSAELLRLPSLLAGVACIPLTYLLGLRTAGPAAGLAAAALVALSPFTLYYSVEARAYQVAIAFVLLSTISLLAAAETGRRRWWAAYAASAAAAVLTHYTAVFALVAQLGWLLWTHPSARRPALAATGIAALGFLPWANGAAADFSHPTNDIISALQALTLDSLRVALEHWAVGHPFVSANTTLRALPGTLALVLLGLSLAVTIAGLVFARERLLGDRRLALVAVLAVATPVGVVAVSLVGTDIVSARNLAVSWPALAVLAGALVTRAPRAAAGAAVALLLAAFAIGAARLLEQRFARPDYDQAARDIEERAAPGDVVIDGTTYSPAPVTPLEAALEQPRALVQVGSPRVEFKPSLEIRPPLPAAAATRAAIAAAPGKRVLVVLSESGLDGVAPPADPFSRNLLAALPRGYRRAELKGYSGILRLALLVYEPPAS